MPTTFLFSASRPLVSGVAVRLRLVLCCLGVGPAWLGSGFLCLFAGVPWLLVVLFRTLPPALPRHEVSTILGTCELCGIMHTYLCSTVHVHLVVPYILRTCLVVSHAPVRTCLDIVFCAAHAHPLLSAGFVFVGGRVLGGVDCVGKQPGGGMLNEVFDRCRSTSAAVVPTHMGFFVCIPIPKYVDATMPLHPKSFASFLCRPMDDVDVRGLRPALPGQVPEKRAVPALPARDHRALLHRSVPDLLGDGQHDPGPVSDDGFVGATAVFCVGFAVTLVFFFFLVS